MYIDSWFIPLGRDPFSMVSHLVGAVLSLVATFFLVRRARRNGMRGLGVGAYGFIMALAFSTSALFHFVGSGSPRYELYNKLDHMAIFLMIAGTGTAIYGSLRPSWTNRVTRLLWATTLGGMLLILSLWPLPAWLSATIYLTIGWLGSLGVFVIGYAIGWRPVRLFILGAVVFTLGAVVFAVGWPSIWSGVIGAHGFFHLLVLLGAGLHFGFIYRRCTNRFDEHSPPCDQSRVPDSIPIGASEGQPSASAKSGA